MKLNTAATLAFVAIVVALVLLAWVDETLYMAAFNSPAWPGVAEFVLAVLLTLAIVVLGLVTAMLGIVKAVLGR